MALSINQLKYVRSLRLKKFRQKYDIFIAEGDKIAQEFLSSELMITSIYGSASWIEENQHILINHNIKYIELNKKEIRKISSLKTPPEVLLLVKIPDQTVKENIFRSGHHIYLDRIQDPGNLGTIIRIADWFGFKSITKSPDSVDFFNSKVVQSSMGSLARVQLMTVAWNELKEIKSLPNNVYGTSADGQNLFEVRFTKNSMTIFGNESLGISNEIISSCKKIISIPKPSGSATESLNVSVAAGIICAQISIS